MLRRYLGYLSRSKAFIRSHFWELQTHKYLREKVSRNATGCPLIFFSDHLKRSHKGYGASLFSLPCIGFSPTRLLFHKGLKVVILYYFTSLSSVCVSQEYFFACTLVSVVLMMSPTEMMNPPEQNKHTPNCFIRSVCNFPMNPYFRLLTGGFLVTTIGNWKFGNWKFGNLQIGNGNLVMTIW